MVEHNRAHKILREAVLLGKLFKIEIGFGSGKRRNRSQTAPQQTDI